MVCERAGHVQRAQALCSEAAQPLATPSVHRYYRTLALKRLGRQEEAHTELLRLYQHATSRENDEPRIDYFATSLPNFLLFEDDLKKRNKVECLVLEAYAEFGLRQAARALELFSKWPNSIPPMQMRSRRLRD